MLCHISNSSVTDWNSFWAKSIALNSSKARYSLLAIKVSLFIWGIPNSWLVWISNCCFIRLSASSFCVWLEILKQIWIEKGIKYHVFWVLLVLEKGCTFAAWLQLWNLYEPMMHLSTGLQVCWWKKSPVIYYVLTNEGIF